MALGVLRSSLSAASTSSCGASAAVDALQQVRELDQRRARLHQPVDGPVDGLPILRAEHGEAQHAAGPAAARRTVCVASNSLIVTKLPRLFDIFSPSTCRKPLCIQTFAITAVPCAQRDCATSFS